MLVVVVFLGLIVAAVLPSEPQLVRTLPTINILQPRSVWGTAGELEGVTGETTWTLYNEGIRWEQSLDHARQRAAREGKPILLHQLVGDMNSEGC